MKVGCSQTDSATTYRAVLFLRCQGSLVREVPRASTRLSPSTTAEASLMSKSRKLPRNANLDSIAEDLRPLAERLAGLTEDPDNANEHNEESIRRITASLERFGQVLPLVVKGNVVRGGNGTLRAMLGLGWKYAAVKRVDDLTDDDATALAITLNRSAEASGWNRDVLQRQLRDLEAKGFEPGGLGFSPDDLAELEQGVAAAVARDSGGSPVPPADNYSEQYGVIIICEDEGHQQRVYEELKAEGRTVRIVTT